MERINDKSPAIRARASLARHGFAPSRSLGQNFILREDILRDVIAAAGISCGERVLEIGPGAGVFTALIAEKGASVLAIEIDRALEPVLRDTLEPYANVAVKYMDASKADLTVEAFGAWGGAPYRVVSNLPYYLTSELVEKFARLDPRPYMITVMLQAEAAERIMSKPGDRAYCSLSAKVALYGCAEIAMRLPPEAFDPSPKIDSCLVNMRAREAPIAGPECEGMMIRLIDACFAMRRKTLANNLRASFALDREGAESALGEAGIPPMARGESLSLGEIKRLAEAMLGIGGYIG